MQVLTKAALSKRTRSMRSAWGQAVIRQAASWTLLRGLLLIDTRDGSSAETKFGIGKI